VRRRWINLFAALPLVVLTAAQAIDFDPNEVYDLVEPMPRAQRPVRVVDARDTPSAAAQILPNGIRLGETQFRQPPPEALRQSLETAVDSPGAQARLRELLGKMLRQADGIRAALRPGGRRRRRRARRPPGR